MALLGFLAVEARPVARERLAGLFWPDLATTEGKGELRRSLHNLSTILPGCFQADRRAITFNPDDSWLVDIHRFEFLAKQGDVASLTEAAELYRGDLLEGLYLDDSPDFETWLLGQQEKWRRQVIQILSALISHNQAQQDYEEGLRLADRLLALEPWHESAHRQMMTLLARTGQYRAALAQYERCRQVLERELGVEPVAETVVLYQRLRQAATIQRHNLPHSPTPFIGRFEELSVVKGQLLNPECRLLTLVGPGGFGKTRLALAAAGELTHHFLDGVRFVSLANEEPISTTADLLTSALTTSLEISLYPGEAPSDQIIDFLREKEMLLLLDNVEALNGEARLAADKLISQLLTSSPQVTLLATSREALNLQGEWLYRVTGLTFPKEGAKVEDKITAGSETEAVALFVQCARRIRQDFTLEGNETAVIQICQMVEGMPLALELAAAWTRIFSCESIITELENSLDILTTDQPNLPPRQRSVRAVLAASWNQLSSLEQQVLARLSCFQGDFEWDIARQVVGDALTLPRLANLVDKALLQLSLAASERSPNRYRMHALLRQFIREQVQKTGQNMTAAAQRYVQVYTSFLHSRENQLRTAKRNETIGAIRLEIENIRRAWRLIIRQRNWAAAARCLETLFLFYEISRWFEEGELVFGQGDKALNEQEDKVPDVLHVQIQSRRAWFSWRLGHYERAESMVSNSYQAAHSLGLEDEIPFASFVLGGIAIARGDYAKAQNHYRKCLACWRDLGNQWGTAITLFNLGLVHQALGEYHQARGPYQEGLAIFKEVGFQFGATTAVGMLGHVARSGGDYTTAYMLCQESLTLHRQRNDPWGVAAALDSLGAISCGLGNLDEAEDAFRGSLAIRRRLQDHRGVAKAHDSLGQVAFAQGDYKTAEKHCQKSLEAHRRLGDQRGLAFTLKNLGDIAYETDAYTTARVHYRESLAYYEMLGNQAGIAAVYGNLGYVEAALKNIPLAHEHFQAAYHSATAISTVPVALDAVLGLGLLYFQEGDESKAQRLLAVILRHPAINEELVAKVKRLLPTLSDELDIENFSEQPADDLEAAVTDILDLT